MRPDNGGRMGVVQVWPSQRIECPGRNREGAVERIGAAVGAMTFRSAGLVTEPTIGPRAFGSPAPQTTGRRAVAVLGRDVTSA